MSSLRNSTGSQTNTQQPSNQYSTASRCNTQKRAIPNSVIKLVSTLRTPTASQPSTQQDRNPIRKNIPIQYSTAYHAEFSHKIGGFSPTLNRIPIQYSAASQPSTQQHPNPILNSVPYRIQLLNWCLPPILHHFARPRSVFPVKSSLHRPLCSAPLSLPCKIFSAETTLLGPAQFPL